MKPSKPHDLPAQRMSLTIQQWSTAGLNVLASRTAERACLVWCCFRYTKSPSNWNGNSPPSRHVRSRAGCLKLRTTATSSTGSQALLTAVKGIGAKPAPRPSSQTR